MTKKPTLKRLLELQSLLHTFQSIERALYPPYSTRHENDTEHSYNLAMTGWFLASHFPHLDRDRVIRLALVHDLVEIYAGDTYFYGDEATLASKIKREAAALERLRSEWTDFPEMTETIHSYEQRESEEAKFVYALDKIMPIMVIYLGNGETWKQDKVTHQQLHSAKRDKVTASEEINDYYQQLHQLLLENPDLFPPEPSQAA